MLTVHLAMSICAQAVTLDGILVMVIVQDRIDVEISNLGVELLLMGKLHHGLILEDKRFRGMGKDIVQCGEDKKSLGLIIVLLINNAEITDGNGCMLATVKKL